MATAQQLTTRALRRLGVLDALQAPSAEDVQTGTEALNAMIASWETQGLSGDVLPLDSRFEAGVVAMLAMRLSEEYGKSPGPVLVRDADAGWHQLCGAFMAPAPLRYDLGLMTRQHMGYTFELQTGRESFAAWQAGTDYDLRTYIIASGNLYECITAGTSGTTAPSGTQAIIVDGTCEWCFRRVWA